jgi:hypothetical protein
MIPLYAIMRDYIMIIRDYFYDYFTDYFAIILRLYAIIFSIIHDYFTASAPGKWECEDSNS